MGATASAPISALTIGAVRQATGRGGNGSFKRVEQVLIFGVLWLWAWAGLVGAYLPDAPTSVTVSSITDSTLDVSWTAPTDFGNSSFSTYNVYSSTDGGSSYSFLASEASTTYSASSMDENTEYYFKVSTSNQQYEGDLSSASSGDYTGFSGALAISVDSTTFELGEITTITIQITSDNSLSSSNTDVASLTLAFSGTGSCVLSESSDMSSSSGSLSLSTVSAGSFTLTATAYGECSAVSDAAGTLTLSYGGTLHSLTNGTATLSVDMTGTTAVTTTDEDATSALSYVAGDSTEYTLSVALTSTSGDSNPDAVSFTLESTGTAGGCTVSAASGSGYGTSATLTADASSLSATGYLKCSSAANNDAEITLTQDTQTGYDFTGLTKTFVVYTAPDAPTGLTADAVGYATATLSWDQPSWAELNYNNLTQWTYTYSSADGDSSSSATDITDTGSAGVSLSGLTDEDAAYTFTLSATNDAGAGSDATYTFTTGMSGSLELSVSGSTLTTIQSGASYTFTSSISPTETGDLINSDVEATLAVSGGGCTVGGASSQTVTFSSGSDTGTAYTLTCSTVSTSVSYSLTQTSNTDLYSFSAASASSVTVYDQPDAPTGIAADSVSYDSANISWTDPGTSNNAEVTSWNYWCNGGSDALSGSVSSATVSFSSSLGSEDTAYIFTVEAVNEYSQTGDTSTYTFTTGMSGTLELTVDGSTATSFQSGESYTFTTSISPTNSGDLINSDVEATLAISGGGCTVGGASSQTVTFSSGTDTGTSYTVTCDTVTSSGVSYSLTQSSNTELYSFSSASTSSVTVYDVPDAPTGLSVDSVTYDSATITWSTPSDDDSNYATVTSWTWYYSTSAGGDSSETDVASESASLSSLTEEGTEYTFYVLATNEAGDGSWASTTFTTGMTGQYNVTLTFGSAEVGVVELEKGYEYLATVEIIPSQDGSVISDDVTANMLVSSAYCEVSDDGGTTWSSTCSLTFSSGSNTANENCYVRCTTVTSAAAWLNVTQTSSPTFNSFSDFYASSVTVYDVPDAPTLDSVTQATIYSATVEFSTPSNDNYATIDGYKIFYEDDSGTILATETTSLSTDVSDLVTDTTYTVWVSAHNKAGWGANSSTIDVLIEPGTLSSVSSSLEFYMIGGVGNATISCTTENDVSAGGWFEVEFPTEMDLTSASIVGSSVIDAASSSISGQVVTASLSTGTTAGDTITLVLTSMTNPSSTGDTADFSSAKTLESDGSTSIDESSSSYHSSELDSSGFTITDAPSITTVLASGDTMPTDSPYTTITITGSSFTIYSSGEVKALYSNDGGTTTIDATDCSITTSDTTIECTSAEGYGTDYAWSVTVGGDVYSSYSSSTLNYTTPSISGVAYASGVSSLETQGGSTAGYITITGSNFGPSSNSDVEVTYKNAELADLAGSLYTATDCEFVTAHTELKCYAAAGVGTGHSWKVKVEDLVSAYSSDTTSYSAPSISSISPSLIATDGSDSVTLTGTNFGPVSTENVISATYAQINPSAGIGLAGIVFNGTNCAVSTAHTEIVCDTVEGVGIDHYWTVDVGGQSNDAETDLVATGYSPPTISDLSGSVSSVLTLDTTFAFQTVTIVGSSFGPANPLNYMNATYQTVDSSLSGLAASLFDSPSCTVSSDSVAVCETARGVGNSFAWNITIGDQTSAPSGTSDSGVLMDYPAPSISGVASSVSLLDTRGLDSEYITITGEHFGPVLSINYVSATYENQALLDYGTNATGPFTAVSCEVDNDDTRIVCNPNIGVGYDHAWTIDVGGQTDTSTSTTSYQGPTISSIEIDTDGNGNSLDALDTRGDTILINGDYFGPESSSNNISATYQNSGLANLGGEAYNVFCEVIDPHVQMRCKVAAGVGYEQEWTVDVGGQQSNETGFTSSYAGPTISSIDAYSTSDITSLNTDGTDQITVTGDYFGPVDSSNIVSANYNNSELANLAGKTFSSFCTVTDQTGMICNTAPGVGYDQAWRVTVGDQDSPESSGVSSYGLPQINTIASSGGSIAALDTRGGDTLTISGYNFGPATPSGLFMGYENPVNASYHHLVQDASLGLAANTFYATSCSITVNHTQIECTSAAGVGIDHYWTLTVGGQTETSEVNTSYARPEISGFGASSSVDFVFDSTEGQRLEIHGDYFGPVHINNFVNASYWNPKLDGYGGKLYDALECNVTTDHTVMECTSVPGVGHDHPWKVRVGNQISQSSDQTSNAVTSYPAPEISSITADLFDTSGGDSITIAGSNFGPLDESNYVNGTYQNGYLPGLGGSVYLASSCSVTSAHTQLECTSVEGIGKNQKWHVQIGGQYSSESTDSTSYKIPVITSLYADDVPLHQLQTDGSDTFMVSGEQFGPVNDQNLVFTLYNNSQLSHMAGREYNASCTVETAHSVLRCSTAPGVGVDFRHRVFVGYQESNQGNQYTSYAPPAISSIVIDSGSSLSLSTSGDEFVTITGTNFGPLSSEYGDASNIVNATYSRYGMGASEELADLQFNATSCEVTTSHTEMVCTSAAGVGTLQYWSVYVGTQTNNLTEFTNYTAPSITEINAVSSGSYVMENTTGNEVITLTGENFGPVTTRNLVSAYYKTSGASNLAGNQYDATSCSVTIDHTQMECTSVEGVGSLQQWRVMVGNQYGDASTVTTSYPVPVIEEVYFSGGSLDTVGGETITITGQQFGPVSPENIVNGTYQNASLEGFAGSLFIADSCSVVKDHVKVECNSIEGVGQELTWRLEIGDQWSDSSVDTISYTAPEISSLVQDSSSSNLDSLQTDASDYITITGSYFGPVRDDNIVYGYYTNDALLGLAGALYTVSCTVVSQDSVLKCETAEGVGIEHKWKVQVGSQFSGYSTDTTSYEAPTISDIPGTIDSLSTEGGEVITIQGNNFGPSSYNGITNEVNATYERLAHLTSTLMDQKFNATQCVVSTAHLVIECYTAEGVGVNHYWTVEVGTQTNTPAESDPATSYAPPSIDSLNGISSVTLGSTSAGEVITIQGSNFGPVSALNEVNATYESLDSSVVGLAAGPFVATGCTVTTSHTSVECQIIAGVGTDHSWIITVGSQESDYSSALSSYPAPEISSITSAPLSTEGSEIVTLSGQNFGPVSSDNSVNGTYQNEAIAGLGGSMFRAQSCSVTTADSVIECYSVEGVGFDQQWILNVGYQDSSLSSSTTSYKIPSITLLSVDSDFDMPDLMDFNTQGGQSLILEGTDFGPAHDSNIAYGTYQNAYLTSLAGMNYSTNCTVLNHTQARCYLTEGVGFNQSWTIEVGMQKSNLSSDSSSYLPPNITSFLDDSGFASQHIRMSTSGDQEITLSGQNFGPVDSTYNSVLYPNEVYASYQSLGARVGLASSSFVASSCSVALSHVQIVCTSVEGVGYEQYWTLEVGSQTNVPVVTDPYSSYKRPSVSLLQGVLDYRSLSTYGSESITISGDNFGPVNAENYVWANYSNPSLVSITTLGGSTYEASSCDVTQSHTTIVCQTVEGVGYDHAWTLEVGHQLSNTSAALTSYLGPQISDISASVLDTRGGEQVTVTGDYFGPVSADNTVYAEYYNEEFEAQWPFAAGPFNGTSCSVTVAQTQAICTSSAGVGYNHSWTISIGNQYSNNSKATTSYRVPLLYSVGAESVDSPSLSTQGNEEVSLTGNFFGPENSLNFMWAAYQNAAIEPAGSLASALYNTTNCTVLSHTQAVCISEPGVGFDHIWKVRVGGQQSDASNFTTSYTPPEVIGLEVDPTSSPFYPDMASDGSGYVIVTGSNFGPENPVNYGFSYYRNFSATYPQLSAAVYYANCTIKSHTEAWCKQEVGVGFGMQWKISIGAQWSNYSGPGVTLSYAQPRVYSFNPESISPGLSTQGGEVVTITGENFGPEETYLTSFTDQLERTGFINLVYSTYKSLDLSVEGLAGETFVATDCNVTADDVQMQCFSTVGVGYDHYWQITVGEQSGPYNASQNQTNYHRPIISSINGVQHFKDLDTKGFESVTITGTNFGPVDSMNNVSFYYENPSLASISALAGAQFNATSCRVTIDHTTALCSSAIGVGHDQYWFAKVGYQYGPSSSAVTSYTQPRIDNVRIVYAETLRTSGGELVEINGTDFGPGWQSNEIFGFYQNPNLENLAGSLLNASSCEVRSHESALCYSGEGVGFDQQWRLLVGDQVSNFSSNTTSYTVPSINESFPEYDYTSLLTNGSQEIVINGHNFGPVRGDNVVEASYQNQIDFDLSELGGYLFNSSSCTVTVSHKEMMCLTVPGVGFEHHWKVVVGSQTSNYSNGTTSYGYPVIDSYDEDLKSNGMNTTGYEPVILQGYNLGPNISENLVSGFYITNAPEDACGNSEYPGYIENCLASRNYTSSSCRVGQFDESTNQGEIVCLSEPGVGENFVWYVKVGKQENQYTVSSDGTLFTDLTSNLVSYKVPIVASLSSFSSALNTHGNETISIYGEQFGPPVKSNSPIVVYCKECTPSSAGTSVSSNTGLEFREHVAYDCSVLSHYEMNCTTIWGVGKGHTWYVSIGNQWSSDQVTSSYVGPVISDVCNPCAAEEADNEYNTIDTRGGEEITITGENFGPSVLTLSSYGQLNIVDDVSYVNQIYAKYEKSYYSFDGRNCKVVNDSSLIICKSNVGVGTNLLWSVTVGNQTSSQNGKISYTAPSIDSIDPLVGPISVDTDTGTTYVTVIGQNFGPPEYLNVDNFGAVITIGSEDCSVITQNHLNLTCTLPGQDDYGSKSFDVEVASQTSNSKTFYYYEIGSIDPVYGPYYGSTRVKVSGFGIEESYSTGFFAEFDSVNTTGFYVSSERVRFSTPEISEPSSSYNTFNPLISFNGQSWTKTTNKFYAYRLPQVSSIDPPLGPVTGQTVVTITGKYFYDTSVVWALFGDADPVNCTWVKTTQVICTTPETLAGKGYVQVNVSVDTKDTNLTRYSQDYLSFYYHELNYPVLDVFPAIVPIAGNDVDFVFLMNKDPLIPTIPESYLDDIKAGFAGQHLSITKSYHREIILFNPYGSQSSDLGNFVALLELNTTGCSDLHFWDSDMITELYYWIDNTECESTGRPKLFYVSLIDTTFDGDEKSVYFSYGNGLDSTGMDADEVFVFYDGDPITRSTSLDCLGALDRWYIPSITETSCTDDTWTSTVKIDDSAGAYMQFLGEQAYALLPRTLDSFTTDVIIRSSWFGFTQDLLNQTYVMYISTSTAALYLPGEYLTDLATITVQNDGLVSFFGRDPSGVKFSANQTCTKISCTEESCDEQVPVDINILVNGSSIIVNVTGCSESLEMVPFPESEDDYWLLDGSSGNTTSGSLFNFTAFNDFYLYAGTSSTQDSSWAPSFEYISVQTSTTYSPGYTVSSNDSFWRLEFSSPSQAHETEAPIRVSLNGQEDSNFTQYTDPLISVYQYVSPVDLAASPSWLFVDDLPSHLTINSSSMVNAIKQCSQLSCNWTSLPMNEIEFGVPASSYIPSRDIQVGIKMGSVQLSSCSETESHSLICQIPDEVTNFTTGNIQLSVTFNGYDYVTSPNSSVSLYDFTVSSSDSLAGSYTTGTSFSLLVKVSGVEAVDPDNMLLYFGDPNDTATNALAPSDYKLVSSSTYAFDFDIPSILGLPACDRNATTYYCPYTKNINGTIVYSIPSAYQNCSEISGVTCPYDSYVNCTMCPDEGMYPCFRQLPMGGGTCLPPSGAWSSTGATDIEMQVTFDSLYYKDAGTFSFYDETAAVSGLPSPLLGQSADISTDATMDIYITDGDFTAQMVPNLKFVGSDQTLNFTGSMQYSEYEVLSDEGTEDSGIPPILSTSMRIQSIYTAKELTEGEFTQGSYGTVSLRAYSTLYSHLYDVRIKYALINESEFNVLNTSYTVKDEILAPVYDSSLVNVLGPSFFSVYDLEENMEDSSETFWMDFVLDKDIYWDGESNLLFDFSYRCENVSGVYSDVGGLSLHPVYDEYRTWYMVETNNPTTNISDFGSFVPYLAMTTSTLLAITEGVAIPATTTDTSSTVMESYDLYLSLNNRDYLNSKLEDSYNTVTFSAELTGVTQADITGNAAAFKTILANALQSNFSGITSSNLLLDSVSESSSSRRSLAERRRLASSSSTTVSLSMVESTSFSLVSSQGNALYSASQVQSSLETSFKSGTSYDGDLASLFSSYTSGSFAVKSVSSFYPETSSYYSAVSYINYAKDDIVVSAVSPSSGSATGGHYVKVTGEKFFEVDGYNITLKWAVSGTSKLFYSQGYYFDDTIIESTTPSIPTSLYDSNAAQEVEVFISFNGITYLDTGPTYKYYLQPYVVEAYVIDQYGDTVYETPQSGKYEDNSGEYLPLYLYMKGLFPFIRKTSLVCVFREEADSSLDQLSDINSCTKGTDCVTDTIAYLNTSEGTTLVNDLTLTAVSDLTASTKPFGLGDVYSVAVFSCELPSLTPGEVRITFSNNAFSGSYGNYDFAYELDGAVVITSNDCDEGYATDDASIPCSMCPAGTYEQDRECIDCSKNFYQASEGSTYCNECPSNTYTEAVGSDSIEDCICYEGYYNPNLDGGSGVACVACADNAVCEGGTETPYPVEGYYRDLSGVYGTNSSLMSVCVPETACPGGPSSPCRTGYSGDNCGQCTARYYRLGHYCALCPPPLLVSFMLPAQLLLYAGALLLFSWYFDSAAKIGSVGILIRFVQITYIMMNYELSWQGTHEGIYDQSDGILESYSTDVYEIDFFPVFRALSPLMPLFFFPDFPETAATECQGYFNYSSGSSGAAFFYAWIIPTVLFGYQMLVWLFLHGRNYGISLNVFKMGLILYKRMTGHHIVDYSKKEENEDELTNIDHTNAKSGQKELDKLFALLVGAALCLMPFFLRKGLRILTCSSSTIGVACTPENVYQMLALLCIMAVMVGIGIIFLESASDDGPYKFLCKSKVKTMKKWDFYTHCRMMLIVVTTFVSSNGVFQAGFALTLLLINMVIHAFSNPYKHPRCNNLERLAFLSNISMLFVGMVGSIGLFPNAFSAEVIQVFGMFLFGVSFLKGFWDVLHETHDRVGLVRIKQGKPNLTFSQWCRDLLLGILPGPFAKFFPDPIVAHHEDEETVVQFVSQLMDALLPKQRDGTDPFAMIARTTANNESIVEKVSPLEEIKRLLFSHAVTKREMFKIRKVAYNQWLALTTKMIYMTVYDITSPDFSDENFADEKAVLRLKTCVKRLSRPERGLVTRGPLRLFYWLQGTGRLLAPNTAAAFLGSHPSLREKRLRNVWMFLFDSHLITDFSLDSTKMAKRIKALHKFGAIWEKVVGQTTEKDIAKWFHWRLEKGPQILRNFDCLEVDKPQGFLEMSDRDKLQHINLDNQMNITLPTREQVMLDWFFDSNSDLELVNSLHKATVMLGNEYQNMIRTSHSFVKGCKEVLSPTRMAREASKLPALIVIEPPDSFDDAAESQQLDTPIPLEVSACFAGDILRYRLHLQNCFGNDIVRPSKRLNWIVKLRPIFLTRYQGGAGNKASFGRRALGALSSALRPQVTDVEVLRAVEDPDNENFCILEFAIPRGMEQMAYRVDVYDYFSKLGHQGEVSECYATTGEDIIKIDEQEAKRLDLKVGDSIEVEVGKIGKMEDSHRVPGSSSSERSNSIASSVGGLDLGQPGHNDEDGESKKETELVYFEAFLVVARRGAGQYRLDRAYRHDLDREPGAADDDDGQGNARFGRSCARCLPRILNHNDSQDIGESHTGMLLRKIENKGNIIYVQNELTVRSGIHFLCFGHEPTVTFKYPKRIRQGQELKGYLTLFPKLPAHDVHAHGARLRVELWHCVRKKDRFLKALPQEELWDMCALIQFEIMESMEFHAKDTDGNENSEEKQVGDENERETLVSGARTHDSRILVKPLLDMEYKAIVTNNQDVQGQALLAQSGGGDNQEEKEEEKDDEEDEYNDEGEEKGQDRKHIQPGCGIDRFSVAMADSFAGDEDDEEDEDDQARGKHIEVNFRIQGEDRFKITKYRVKAFVMGVGQDHYEVPILKDDAHGKNGYIWALDEDGTLHTSKDPEEKEAFYAELDRIEQELAEQAKDDEDDIDD